MKLPSVSPFAADARHGLDETGTHWTLDKFAATESEPAPATRRAGPLR
jgi:hypothetical protein